MKKVFLVLCMVVAGFAAVAQKGQIYTIGTGDKITIKDCLKVEDRGNIVIFVVDKNTQQVFFRISEGVWIDRDTERFVWYQDKGTHIMFWKTTKQAYMYGKL
jgi:hypothetical protein